MCDSALFSLQRPQPLRLPQPLGAGECPMICIATMRIRRNYRCVLQHLLFPPGPPAAAAAAAAPAAVAGRQLICMFCDTACRRADAKKNTYEGTCGMGWHPSETGVTLQAGAEFATRKDLRTLFMACSGQIQELEVSAVGSTHLLHGAVVVDQDLALGLDPLEARCRRDVQMYSTLAPRYLHRPPVCTPRHPVLCSFTHANNQPVESCHQDWTAAC